MHRLPVHRLGVVVAFLITTLAATVGLALPANAEGVASVMVVEGNLGADGVFKVQQTITFSGAVPAQVSQKFELRQNALGDRQYVQTLSDITASVGGAAVTPQVSEDSRFTTVTVPTNGASVVQMGYTVRGATIITTTGTALRWAVLQGLSAQVTDFVATVQVPGQFEYVRCTAGPPNSTVPCRSAAGGMEGAQIPTFRDGPRGEGEFVVVDIGFPPGTVASTEEIDYVWTVGRAFSATPLTLAVSLGLLALGAVGLLLLHRRAGEDSKPSKEIIKAAEFAPSGAGQSSFHVLSEIRPGHVGTVVDERVDPVDVTASILDLAVRGHLQITEQARSSEYGRLDWVLSRRSGPDDLHGFEKVLLDGIAPEGGQVKVSELSGRVHDSIGAVQSTLYDEVVTNGWYDHRPDATRTRWTRLAIGGLVVAVAVTVLLAAFTIFGLVGLALVALALGLAFVAQEMPSRTAKGAALLAGLGALRSDLMSHPTNQMPPGQELEEISGVLPYAVVLGGADRWLDAVVAADSDEDADSSDLTWYHGPENWHLRDLPDSLRNFITMVEGSLFAR